MNILNPLDSIALDTEIWVSPGVANTVTGTGTKINPYRPANGRIESIISLLGASVRLNLAAGLYYTNGFRVPKKIIISGAGIGKTEIKLLDNANGALNFPHIRMIMANAADGWSDLFGLQNCTINGNIQNQPEFKINGNYKIEPVVVYSVVAKASNVEVINFGSNGTNYILPDGNVIGAGLEAFPLCLTTFANGDPFNYYDWAKRFIDIEAQTYVEISDCRVTDAHYIGGGYCTGVMPITNQKGMGDRQDVGVRNTLAGLVRNNFVSVGYGIAYGTAGSEMVRFEGNISKDTKCGFNCDTEHVTRIEIVGNQFINCSQGISFQPGYGTGNKIEKNIFIMGKPAFNQLLKKNEPYYAIHTKRTVDSFSDSNIYITNNIPFDLDMGIPDTNSVILSLGANNPELEKELIVKLAQSQVELTASVTSGSELQSKYSQLVTSVSTYKNLSNRVRMSQDALFSNLN
jgi:hypothetical protein